MKVYCISGIGADESVFELLSLDHQIICVHWVSSHRWESMSDYAKRLCEQVDTSEPFVLMGVSFGGMLAVEMNRFIQPQKTILVTSLARKSEFPFWIRWISKTRINRVIPTFMFSSNPNILFLAFGIKSDWVKEIVRKIAKNADKEFTKLSIDKVLTWQNERLPDNLIRIYAEKDILIPNPKNSEGIEIKDTGHFAIIEKAEEISVYVNEILCSSN